MAKPTKPNVPGAAMTVILKLISTGHVFTLTLLVLGGGLIYKLSSTDLAATIKLLVQSPFALVLGWSLAVTFFVGGGLAIRGQRDFYLKEIERLRASTKELARETQGVLPLSQISDDPIVSPSRPSPPP